MTCHNGFPDATPLGPRSSGVARGPSRELSLAAAAACTAMAPEAVSGLPCSKNVCTNLVEPV